MKRVDLLRHLERNGCVLLREGAKHTVYHNPKVQRDCHRASAQGDQGSYCGTYLQGFGCTPLIRTN